MLHDVLVGKTKHQTATPRRAVRQTLHDMSTHTVNVAGLHYKLQLHSPEVASEPLLFLLKTPLQCESRISKPLSVCEVRGEILVALLSGIGCKYSYLLTYLITQPASVNETIVANLRTPRVRPRHNQEFHDGRVCTGRKTWDNLGGCSNAAEATDKQTNSQTDGHHHRVKPPL